MMRRHAVPLPRPQSLEITFGFIDLLCYHAVDHCSIRTDLSLSSRRASQAYSRCIAFFWRRLRVCFATGTYVDKLVFRITIWTRCDFSPRPARTGTISCPWRPSSAVAPRTVVAVMPAAGGTGWLVELERQMLASTAASTSASGTNQDLLTTWNPFPAR